VPRDPSANASGRQQEGLHKNIFSTAPREDEMGFNKNIFFKAFIVEMPDWEHKPNLD
jgi:hypothetical protein